MLKKFRKSYTLIFRRRKCLKINKKKPLLLLSGYEQYIDIPEFTFMGVHDQPDFGHIKIWFHGEKSTVELKSLKEYLLQYRDTVISYERTIDCLSYPDTFLLF
jgi:7-cyano-7-deazaguanine reductase